MMSSGTAAGPAARIGVKICGIADADAFDAAIAHAADWLGFVFFARSPRAVSPAQAAALSARHPGGAERIGLFVHAADQDIAACLDVMPLDGLQVYDSPERVAAIRARFGLPVWLACPVSASSDLPRAPDCDRLVIESRAPARAATASRWTGRCCGAGTRRVPGCLPAASMRGTWARRSAGRARARWMSRRVSSPARA